MSIISLIRFMNSNHIVFLQNHAISPIHQQYPWIRINIYPLHPSRVCAHSNVFRFAFQSCNFRNKNVTADKWISQLQNIICNMFPRCVACVIIRLSSVSSHQNRYILRHTIAILTRYIALHLQKPLIEYYSLISQFHEY